MASNFGTSSPEGLGAQWRRLVLGCLAARAVACVLAVVGFSARASESSAVWQRLEFTRPQMGVPFRIVVYSRNEPEAQRAVELAYSRITRLNSILSDYDPDSEVNRFCHGTPVGQPAQLSLELWFNIERSQRLARLTDGAFDVTVAPFVNLWRRARRHHELPSPALIEEARRSVGWNHLVLDRRRRTVTMQVPGMRFDFGGIAKGYAADEALRVLKEQGFPRALVAAAGDITVGDPPPDAQGWRVDIGTPEHPGARAGRTVVVRNAAVSTSGDFFQRLVIGGTKYSHIVDPRTGIGLLNQNLVTILARDGITADSVATAVSVLGVGKGLALVERTRGAAALIVEPLPEGGFREHESRRLKSWLKGP